MAQEKEFDGYSDIFENLKAVLPGDMDYVILIRGDDEVCRHITSTKYENALSTLMYLSTIVVPRLRTSQVEALDEMLTEMMGKEPSKEMDKKIRRCAQLLGDLGVE